MQAITNEEKIDYIYKTLKSNKRWGIVWAVFKWGFRIAILWYLYYFFTVWVPSIIDKAVPSFPSFSGQSENWGASQNIDPETIKEMMSIPQVKQLLDSYLK